MTQSNSTPRIHMHISNPVKREPKAAYPSSMQREGAPLGGRWVHFDPVANPYACQHRTPCAMLHAGVVYRPGDLRWMSHGANSERTCRSGAQAYNAETARTDRPATQ